MDVRQDTAYVRTSCPRRTQRIIILRVVSVRPSGSDRLCAPQGFTHYCRGAALRERSESDRTPKYALGRRVCDLSLIHI